MLYALRYEKMVGHQVPALMESLKKQGVSEEKLLWVERVLKYSGSDVRQVDSFSLESIISRGKNAIKGLKGVENVYTQHNPHLAQIMEAVLKNKLKEALFPYVDSYSSLKDKPQDIIVFFVNGATYEEARYIAQLNTSTPGVRIVLGGTTIHSATSFIAELGDSSC